jgi:hypothetical protein
VNASQVSYPSTSPAFIFAHGQISETEAINADAKDIFKVPNFRNISICRNLEIKK